MIFLLKFLIIEHNIGRKCVSKGWICEVAIFLYHWCRERERGLPLNIHITHLISCHTIVVDTTIHFRFSYLVADPRVLIVKTFTPSICEHLCPSQRCVECVTSLSPLSPPIKCVCERDVRLSINRYIPTYLSPR